MNDAAETPQQMRESFLRLAAEAEAKALRLTDLKAKAEWTAIAQGWLKLADAICRQIN